MAMSPELQAMYDTNRMKMSNLKEKFHKFFIYALILSVVWFGTSCFLASVRSTQEKCVTKFYGAFGIGTIQILLSLVTLLMSWLTSMRKRIPSLLLLGTYLAMLGLLLMQQGGEIHPTNVVMLIAGIGLHIWAQMLCNEDSELKEQPGYPLFSVNADTHAVYEPSKVVRARAAKASDEMESIGGKKQKKSAGIAKPSEPLLSDDQLLTGLSTLYENRKPGEAPAKLGPISLTTQQVQYTPPANPVPKQPAAPLPEIKLTEFKHHPQYDAHPEMLEQVDASAMLGDMTVHSKKIYNRPHEEMLPQPEEVKRRLAAMKKARQQKG